MKRILTFFLVLTLISGLSACAGSTSEPSGGSSSAPSEPDVPISDSNPSSPESGGSSLSEESRNILIAYFTMPEDVDTAGVDAVAGASIVVRDGEVLGNVEYMASVINETVGGDLFRIETVQQYPLDHDPLIDQAAQEQESDARPELASHIDDPGRYDIIFLGYPKMEQGYICV